LSLTHADTEPMSESDATVKDSKFHGSFEKYNEFVELQKEILSVDVNSDTAVHEDVWQAQQSKLQKLEMIVGPWVPVHESEH
jgi:hypothetical protein